MEFSISTNTNSNMARKVTKEVVGAFIARQPKTSGNTKTNGQSLFLHGNRIAHWGPDGELEISTCGWHTPTTKERLNALPGVSVHTSKGQLYLNGQPWDGNWTVVKNN
jgi:hypothetical protein